MPNRRAKKGTLALDESGMTALVIIVFAALCGCVGLAVDIGHMVLVKAELQRTADAGALAGAMGLVPYINPGPSQTPNWVQAQNKAQLIVNNAANQADNQQFAITSGTVKYGYWSLTPPAGYVQSLPAVPPPPANLPEPAINVTLSRNVTLYLAPVLPGVSSPKTVSATATAILPEAYQTTGVPPVAVSWDTVYDNVGGTVKIDVVEQNIKPQSNKNIAGWFNLDGGNGVPPVRIDAPLIADPNGPVQSGSQIYTVPGTKATLMDYVTAGETVIIPIVQVVEKQGWESIIGWAAFKVDNLSANSMTGHFVDECFDPNVRPTAATSGTIGAVGGTPKLVSP